MKIIFKRFLKLNIFVFSLLTLISSFFLISCSKSNEKIIHNPEVHDGDTFKIDGENIRLLGCDTPEITRTQSFIETSGIERIYAEKARIFAQNFFDTRQTKLEKVKTGKYGRTIAIIHSSDTTISIALLKAGLARVAYISNIHTGSDYKNQPDYYYGDPIYIKKLYLAQEEAAEKRIGVWSRMEWFAKIFPKET